MKPFIMGMVKGGMKDRTRYAIFLCWRSCKAEDICVFFYLFQNNNEWGRVKWLETFSISTCGLVLLLLISIWQKRARQSGFPRIPLSSQAERKRLKALTLKGCPEVLSVDVLWGRSLIWLLSQQTLAQVCSLEDDYYFLSKASLSACPYSKKPLFGVTSSSRGSQQVKISRWFLAVPKETLQLAPPHWVWRMWQGFLKCKAVPLTGKSACRPFRMHMVDPLRVRLPRTVALIFSLG